MSGGRNNNIMWHQAINMLKTSENIHVRLIEESHIEIYLTDYINTAYSIINLLSSSIDSYKFFYGITNYHNRDDIDLFQECGANSFNNHRICPDSLNFLACFLDKATNMLYDSEQNKKSLLDCRKEKYFKKITENYQTSIFTKKNPGISMIFSYIDAYKKCKKESIKNKNSSRVSA